ncbi:23S rRNA (uracil(747)-C(5))-methyltransferase RlmC [Alishewanella tabrizica]|uniref:23S rRNA (uracil(747)-C(5))-methyltransferase RlmC n=1 Tax=Alishewanella tabrizica TaxID=671278 RepID=A0ABQ2WJ55_9ALTE|nr:23S rRNA (uracil(747)-C(5))-methyltransferase RlmC [Alishewanella tabrizica]GGW59180.1 23S rRNA (uracil(747)-C(5))-methyltransferase RlmC [Alishewanella tabrizica]
MFCAHYAADRCRSCQWLDKPYASQLALKQQQLITLLAAHQPFEALPAVASREQAFRYKAKMVVLGSYEDPVLGIVNPQGDAVDLADCPLYPASFANAFTVIKRFIQLAALVPYQVAKREGELKFILLNESWHTGRLMLRFVLRSKNHIAVIQKHLPTLRAQLPALDVVSINLQPQHAAVLEGTEEWILTPETRLRERLNHVPLYLTPQSFFQTNPEIAASLYATAMQWAEQLQAQGAKLQRIWDLFCGVGGFGLHLSSALQRQTGEEPELIGIEIAPAAIASAQQAAQDLGLRRVSFQALDSATFAMAAKDAPDLLMVNPPRRGLGAQLCQDITRLAPRWIFYSSCNPQTLARDLVDLPDYQLHKVQLFDLFAHSSHAEVLLLLERKAR